MVRKSTIRICAHGHRYYKSSDCPTCPACEKTRKPENGFLAELSSPARRALERENIKTLKKLSHYREAQILSLHGMGPAAMIKLKTALAREGLSFPD